MFKKALSLLLSMMLVVTSLVVTVMSVSAAGDTYFVSGCEELTGYKWATTEATCGDNVMTANGDGNYEKVFTNVAVGNGYQFKVVKNDGEEWIGIGDGYEQNFTFNVKTACDVTVTFNPTTKEINVTGDGVDIPKDLVIDHVTAVGNGFGEWLHAKDWKLDADVNNLTETSEGSKVYQITYENLDVYENYQFKFAANSSWADNWGLPESGGAPLNEWFDLTYNGQDMIIDTDEAGYDDGYDIVLTLDLSNFSYATKQGARCKIDIVTGDKPTEPATEEPTTVAAPTTVAPTTEPTTEPAPAADPIYVVAGSEEFAGLKWIGDPVNGAKNVMTKDGDMYSKTFAATPAGKDYQIKVVKNVANGTNPETGETVWAQTWIGYDNTENNLTFDVTAACDVTVTYNPTTNEINVTGDSVKIVKDLKVDYVLPVGNGFQSWLNGEDWKVDAESNKMEMVSDKVYKITYKGVTSSDNYEFKFAANGSWAANWGLPATENSAPVGKDFDLTFNGENMVLDTVALGYAEGSSIDVTLTLDLSGFDYPSKQGAKANITIEGDRLPLLGDADGDFSITIKDATLIQRIAIGLSSTDASKVCDANEDGRISVKDSTIVQKYVVKGYNNTGNVGLPIASAE